MVTVIQASSSQGLNLKLMVHKRLSIYVILSIELLVDFVQEIFLELFKVILIDSILRNWIKSKKWWLREDVLKVSKLFLKQSILSG